MGSRQSPAACKFWVFNGPGVSPPQCIPCRTELTVVHVEPNTAFKALYEVECNAVSVILMLQAYADSRFSYYKLIVSLILFEKLYLIAEYYHLVSRLSFIVRFNISTTFDSRLSHF